MSTLKAASLRDLAEAIRVELYWIEDLTAEGAEDRRIAEVRDLLQPVFSEYLQRLERGDHRLMH